METGTPYMLYRDHCNHYPVEEARRSNMRNRSIGLGVQGLADAFLKMCLTFESEAAQRLNTNVFKTLYFAACEASCDLAERDGAYETYAGSPASKGRSHRPLGGRAAERALGLG